MNTRSRSDPYQDQEVEVLRAMAGLFDDVPHVMFCAKDRASTYLVVNQTFADRPGFASRLASSDESAFTRQFRRVVGMSPGAYRSRARDGNVV
jgi:hypothetical protein